MGGMFKKGDKFIIDRKYYKNITAYIIGKNKDFFVRQFKNKIKYNYFANLKNAISKIKIEIKNDKKIKQFYLALQQHLLINLKTLSKEENISINLQET